MGEELPCIPVAFSKEEESKNAWRQRRLYLLRPPDPPGIPVEITVGGSIVVRRAAVVRRTSVVRRATHGRVEAATARSTRSYRAVSCVPGIRANIFVAILVRHDIP